MVAAAHARDAKARRRDRTKAAAERWHSIPSPITNTAQRGRINVLADISLHRRQPEEKPVKPNLQSADAAQIASIEDQFANLDNLRLSQDFVETCGVKKLLMTIPVRKPHAQDFIRVHPNSAYRESFPAIDLKDERELYVVTRNMQAELSTECVPVTLFTAINRQGVVFLWPVRLPGPDGKINEWSRSAAEAATLAMTQWVRVKANMDLGAYEIFTATGTLQDPTWPELPFNELLRIAFRDRIIDGPDHPVVKRLRGL
jgi:hypothetical protein